MDTGSSKESREASLPMRSAKSLASKHRSSRNIRDSEENLQNSAELDDDVFQCGTAAPCKDCQKSSMSKESFYSHPSWRRVSTDGAGLSMVPPVTSANSPPNTDAADFQNKTFPINNVATSISVFKSINPKDTNAATMKERRRLSDGAGRKRNNNVQQLLTVRAPFKSRAATIGLFSVVAVTIILIIIGIVMLVGILSKGKKKRRHSTRIITGFPFLDGILGNIYRILASHLD